ncbi:MAG TPA: cytochrome ubiquinol oxidase subunit I [Bryobacteraceae bacterium]|nr:cytochrome ubiquinol oxidase subunit I [Bryobacteraceae bacterium]
MDDVALLSRIQFALTIMFHYLFPPLTIGMGVVMVYLEAMYLKRREPIYESAARFWTGLFAVSFAIGVATGIVMEFEFGTNWAPYSRFVGDVFGSALAAEGIFAFFLESGFLAVLVFGWDKVSAGFHFFATLMVSLGSMFSAVWIIVANSWQQTPQGHHIVSMMRDGKPWLVNGEPMMRAEVMDFWQVLLNPSTVNRLTHTLIGAYILGAFFIMSISAFYLLKGRHRDFAMRSFTGALIFATIFSLVQIVSGDFNGRMVARHQPAKLAAFEGHFETGRGDLSLFGYVDEEQRRLRFSPAIPGGLSFLVHRDFNAPVIGLDRFRREDWPPLNPSYASFHIMVGLGMFFAAITVYASVLRLRGTLFDKRWLMWIFVVSVIGPFVANELGWMAAEVGRQPWIVHPRVITDATGGFILDPAGMVQYRLEEGLRTASAVSENITAGQVKGAIAGYSLIYVLLFWVWLFVLNHKIQAGPVPVAMPPHTTARGFDATAAARILHEDSMSEAKEPNREEES